MNTHSNNNNNNNNNNNKNNNNTNNNNVIIIIIIIINITMFVYTSRLVRHPCAGAMLILSVAFQPYRIIPEGNSCLLVVYV